VLADGRRGFTVAQAARLLGCSESSARGKYADASMLDEGGRQLCPENAILEERKQLLERLGATEATEGRDLSLDELRRDRDELAARLVSTEEKIRLIAAARSAAREKVASALAEEGAWMEIAMQDLDPLRKLPSR
jgi:hypothetical protein